MKKTLPISLLIGFLFFTLGSLSAQRWVANPASKGLLAPQYFVIAIKVVDAQTIWAIASRSRLTTDTFKVKILKTTNGGQTWQVKDFPDNLGRYGYDIQAVDSSNAWISAVSWGVPNGFGVAKTTDGGQTWQRTLTQIPSYTRFFDKNNGISVAPPYLSSTTDGGNTWANSTVLNAFTYPSTSVRLTNGTNGCAMKGDTLWVSAQQGRIFRSTDRGRSWATFSTGIPEVFVVWSIAFTDARNGMLIGTENSTASTAKTSDGGVTWQMATAPSGLRSSSNIAAIPNTNAFVVGTRDSVPILGKSFLTRDNGTTWIPFTSNTHSAGAIEFISPQKGWLGNGNIVNATDAAMYSWDAELSLPTNELSEDNHPLSIFPNPAYKTLTIQIEMTEQTSRLLTITDLLGKTVLSKKLDLINGLNQLTVDLPLLASGLYLVKVGDATQRLMIQ